MSAADVLFINVLGYCDCILTDLISKACWPFANEKDLAYLDILIIRSDNTQHQMNMIFKGTS